MIFRHLLVITLFALLLLPGVAFGAPYLAELAAQLAARRAVILKDRDALNAECGAVLSTNAVKVASCKQRRDDVTRRMDQYKADHENMKIIIEAVAGERNFFDSIPQDDVRITLGIEILAKKLRWSAEKQARLEKALKDLGFDGIDPITEENVQNGWNVIWKDADDADLMRAANAAGPRLFSIGQKEGNDCAVAAMATASGLPYDEVAVRAKDLIHQGEWRNLVDRKYPQDAINNGLTGGEVVLLAESLGRAEVVPSGKFEETLKGGRPVMVNVVTISSKQTFPGGTTAKAFGDHEIVLTKTFRYKGKTWYEMTDSRYPDTRFFVPPDKLNLIIQEKGVAFGKEP